MAKEYFGDTHLLDADCVDFVTTSHEGSGVPRMRLWLVADVAHFKGPIVCYVGSENRIWKERNHDIKD